MKRLLNGVILLTLLFGLTGCSHRLGDFSVASSKNVPNMQYTADSSTKIEGESCTKIIIFFPIGEGDARIQRAMDNAIENGHKKGLKGNLLVNARIDSSFWYIPYVYGEDCVSVKGDLVEVNKK